MGDPSEECEIEEDSYYSEYSPQVENSGKVSWILNKGWGIGKKLLVTGAVISSAPFVLPPLVVTSAIAFACWVPCGVVVASYACSEKIMSKLLPYGSNDEDGEFEDAEESVKGDEDSEYLDMDDEKPLMEGINKVNMEGPTYEYSDDVLLDANAISDGVDLVVFSVIEGEDEFGVSPTEVTSVAVEGHVGQEHVSDLLEEEELVKETRGLLEKIRNEGSAADGMEMDIQYTDGTAGSRRDSIGVLLDNNFVGDVVDIYVSDVIEGEGKMITEESEGKEIVNDFMGDHELVRGTRGFLERIRDACSADDAVAMTEPCAGEIERGEVERDEIVESNFDKMKRAVDNTIDENVGLEKPTHTMKVALPKESESTEEKKHVTDANAISEVWGSVSESNNADNTFGVEMRMGEIRIVDNTSVAEKSIPEIRGELRVLSTVVEERHAPEKTKEKRRKAKKSKNNIRQVKFPLIGEKENIVSTNADAIEIADESGLYVFDEKNAPGHVDGEGVDFAELSISSGVAESTDAKMSSQKDDIHSNGVLNNEAKIWKHISSIRSIVGYQVAPQASYMEELKALYLFTGVEPPTSFDDPADLAQVDNKLHFLMSIIGLK